MQPNKDSQDKLKNLKIPPFPYVKEKFELKTYLNNHQLIEQLHHNYLASIDYAERLWEIIGILEENNDEIKSFNLQTKTLLEETQKHLDEIITIKEKSDTAVTNLRTKIDELKETNKNLEIDKRDKEIQAIQNEQSSLPIFALTFFSGLAVTLGGNLLIASPSTWYGYAFLLLGIIGGFVSFFLTPGGKKWMNSKRPSKDRQ